jgi:TonB-linked SusC/RagA family outer membrane protein
MKKRYIQILILLSFVQLLSYTVVIAQNPNKNAITTIESVVIDEHGNPIQGAIIYANEGAIIAKTDALGKFTISIPDQTNFLIESDGFESALFHYGEYSNLKEFSLKSSLSFFGPKDDVNIAFGKVKKGALVNAVSVINPSDILKYDNIQDITQVLSGRVSGMLGSNNIRGIGNALFIVDGLPRDINTINLAEVAQITVLKDINSSVMYGNAAVNGVVLVTTKRGQAYKKQVNVSGYYGISKPTALPNFLSSADYMDLYNEARVNDGLAPQYDAATIAKYRSGNHFRYPNVDYFSSENIKNIKSFSKIMTELSGGNDVTTYYSNLGWENSGSLINFGAGEKGSSSRFNVRGNVDIKINNWIKSTMDAVVVLNNEKGAVGTDYWSEAATRQPNLYSPLLPISLINPNNALLKGRKNDVDGRYLLGGTSSYLSNVFANGYSGGINEKIQRTFSFNNQIDFDLAKITKGLAFHTNVSFDFYTTYNQSVNNAYSVYQPTWNATQDSIISLVQYGSDTRSGNQNVGSANFQRRIGLYGLLDYDRIFGGHHITGSLLGYGNTYKTQNDLQGSKNVNLGLRLAYSFRNKYMADFSSAYVNSVKLPSGNRTALSPTLGLAWVISSEKFMSSLSAIDYLKLKISGGIMNSEAGIDGFYYYDNVYSRSSGYAWFEGTWSNGGTISSFGGNNNLAFEKRNEINVGLEGTFFNRSLSIDGNVFASSYFDQITRPNTLYPSFYANYIPYKNFDNNTYKGAELGLSVNHNLGRLSATLGANALYVDNKVVKKDEIYSYDYQYRTGKPIDARFGLVADGFFMDQADIASHPTQAFGKVKPGDIKYIDQNNDGIIDANDEIQIGRWQSPFSYGLNLKLGYKNLTFFAQGNGRVGADGYMTNNYYWVDNNDKYSDFILNRWTEATKTTATTPRLSSLSNTNNYRSSTFWLYKDNYFTLDRVQVTYEMSEKIAGILKMKNIIFHVDASNLLTISKYKSIRDLSIGTEPFYRSFSIGIKTMF